VCTSGKYRLATSYVFAAVFKNPVGVLDDCELADHQADLSSFTGDIVSRVPVDQKLKQTFYLI